MFQRLLRFFVVAIVYWLAARLSLNLALVHGQVTPVWPPTGIALVAILTMGYSVWPAITVGAFAANLPIGPAPLDAALIAVGNTLAPLVSALLLRRSGFHLQLDRLRDALVLISLGALVGMTVSATVGSTVLLLDGAIPTSSYWATWAVWWTGDAMGVLLVAPLFLSLLPNASTRPISWRRSLEFAAILIVVALLTLALFSSGLHVEYLVIPLIMLAAWRFRLRGAAPAALIASGVAIWSAVHGSGPFAGESLLQKMVTLQVFNVTVAFASFVLAAFVETRERKEEMAMMYLAAQSGNEAKSAFLNMAAHELRTPLSVVIGYASMMADGSLGKPPPKWVHPLEVLNAKSLELSKIVADLLEASRLELDLVTQPIRTRLDLRNVVLDAVARARPRADLIGGTVQARFEAGATFVDGDARQIGRILDNLINNSLTYVRDKPAIWVILATEGPQAIIRLADNGVGIPPEDQERVFDRFHRGQQPEVRRAPGTGLGLYIGREFAAAHSGSLSVESSTEDRGTVMVLTLPLSAAEPAREDTTERTQSSRRSVTSAGRKATTR